MTELLLKASRIRLGDMVEVCRGCKAVPKSKKSPSQEIEFCKSSCSHWLAIQEQRLIVEELQQEVRKRRKEPWKERLTRYAH